MSAVPPPPPPPPAPQAVQPPQQTSREGPFNRPYLRLRDLRRLRHLLFTTRHRMRGSLAGRHTSRQRGHSVEFNDFRQYMPGDELGDLDWKVYARSDRLYVRLYEHETEMSASLLVDASASMAFRGFGVVSPRRGQEAAPSKYDLACRIAAALAFLVVNQRDRVGLGFARRGLAMPLRAQSSMSHLLRILNSLQGMSQTGLGGAAQLADAVQALARSAKRRGVLVVLSDLLDDPAGVRKALAIAQARGQEIILFHVLHADEVHLPNDAAGLFIDSETDERVRLRVEDIRESYEAGMREFLDGWERTARALGVEYHRITTAQDPYELLERVMLGRARRRSGIRAKRTGTG
jgi:uncharacterized protein (DUF58 family)